MAANLQHVAELKISRLLLAALLLIIAVGAGLRLSALDGDSLWLDEAYSVSFAHESPSGIIETTSQDVHPPLYYFALHYWQKLFGDSERSVRMLSALFGILAIFVTYKVAVHLFDRSTGLLAAGLLALSRFHLEFSQEARMYSLLCLLSVLSIYFFIRLMEDKSRWALIGYIVASALMMYTHVYSFFILAAENIYWLTLLFAARDTFRRVWVRWLVAQIVLAVLFLPWLSVQAQQFSRVQQGFWIPKLPPRLLLYTLTMYSGSTQLAWILAPLIALAVLAGWQGWKRRVGAQPLVDESGEGVRASRWKLYLLLLWLLCPIMLPYIVSQFSSPIFLPKYTIAALPAFVILASRGFLSLRFHQLRMIVALLLLCFSVVVLKNYFSSYKKDLWREAVAGLSVLAKPNDLVLFNDQSGQVPFQYYNKRNDLVEKPFPDYHTKLDEGNLAERLKGAIEGHDRVWLVISHPNELSPLIPQQLARWYPSATHLTYPGVEMYLFEKTD
ncbi:MAG TPA: glycosyltransferase family 39 protein [Pyrinomonadaceae bacterium]|nr:glycosyltransferase family 39 protein [Pyrinomonadaceae bacterium]